MLGGVLVFRTARNWALAGGFALGVIVGFYGYSEATCLVEDCGGEALANGIGYGVTSFVIYGLAIFVISLGLQWLVRLMRGPR
jgi:hypothetical protein